ncbi:cytoplasmic tRNA 2-thiolation protein 2 isoform X2 [Aristolochia californica]
MQLKAQMNFDASRDRSLPVFGVGVAFVNESAVSSVPPDRVNEAIKEMELIVSSLAPPAKELHISPLEGIFSEHPEEGKNQLNELLNTISDATGKEDFLQHLRMLSLQKIASDNGYSKVVLGSCASRIACHVISATVKGQGYSLPADVQYVDARWKIPVVLPLRDCLAQELSLLCQLDSLKTLQLLDRPLSGINNLVSSFVSLLQEENPSRERTIVRTAEKLTPFSFNKIPDTVNANINPSLRRRLKSQNLKSNESIAVDVFCAVCAGPLSALEMQTARGRLEISQMSRDLFGAICCQSCSFQILPNDPLSLENFYSLLPEPMLRKVKGANGEDKSWLRGKIEDCLLSDDEAGA